MIFALCYVNKWHLALLLDESFVRLSVDHQGVLICESANGVYLDDAGRIALPHLEVLGADKLEHPVVAYHLFAINPSKKRTVYTLRWYYLSFGVIRISLPV